MDDQVVKNLTVYLNGLRIPNKDAGPMTFESMPNLTTTIDISFEGGGEFEQIPVEVFRTKTYFLFILIFPDVNLRLKTSLEFTTKLQYEMQMERTGQFGRISDELRSMNFLYDLGSGKKITIFIKGISSTTFNATDTAPLRNHAEKYIYYLERLKKIESYYKFKFDKIGKITQESYNMLNLIIDHIDGKPFIGEYTDTLIVSPGNPSQTLKFVDYLKPDAKFGVQSDQLENFILHGKEISMGYRNTLMLEPYIENIEEIKKDPSQSLRIKSGSESVSITFSQEFQNIKANVPNPPLQDNVDEGFNLTEE